MAKTIGVIKVIDRDTTPPTQLWKTIKIYLKIILTQQRRKNAMKNWSIFHVEHMKNKLSAIVSVHEIWTHCRQSFKSEIEWNAKN